MTTEETTPEIKARLEYLRGELRGECISQDELCELQSLAKHIEPGDVELLEPAGVPEFFEHVIGDCVVWAKDRMGESFADIWTASMIDYNNLNAKQQHEFREALAEYNRLMQLPEEEGSTLRELKTAGFWNGGEDTYWEEAPTPTLVPEGLEDLFPSTD